MGMDIVEQIAQYVNPIDFAKLCNLVFTAEYPNDYQVVDGTRGDEGNDGYIRSEERMLQFYCPEKPEKVTDKKLLDKIETDLAKAHRLHTTGRWTVKRWTFITPRPLSNDVLQQLTSKGSRLGISANHLDATYLAEVLLRHRHLADNLHNIYLLEMNNNIREILAILKTRNGQVPRESEPFPGIPSAKRSLWLPAVKTPDFDDARRIVETEQTDTSKSDLKSILYKSCDPYAQGIAILGLLQWYDPCSDAVDDMVAWCDRGIGIANRIGDRIHQAHFTARRGLFLSYKFTFLDMETALSIRAGNSVGVQLVSETQREAAIIELRELEAMFVEAFRNALKLASESRDLRAYGQVMLPIGDAAGDRARHFSEMGLHDRAQQEKETSLNALLTAREAFSLCGDDLSYGYALYSIANQLRFWGERTEALDLLRSSEVIADKYHDFRLQQASDNLRHTIETGRLPDYLHGERPERKK
jgi:hypothetical protein